MMTNEIMIYINYIVGLKVRNKLLSVFFENKNHIAYITNKEKEENQSFFIPCENDRQVMSVIV
jgi:hypothetical protein